MKTIPRRASLCLATGCLLVLAAVGDAQVHQLVVTNLYGECNLLGNSQVLFTKRVVDGAFSKAKDLCAADINKDGYMDLVGASENTDLIAWWKNADGSGTNWTEYAVDAAVGRPYVIDVADVNDDGFPDVLAAAWDDSRFLWWQNADGTGTNWIEHTIASGPSRASDVMAADVDGDGDIDAVGADRLANRVVWWENLGGHGTNWFQHIVDGSVPGPTDLDAADMDRDGDLDILCAADDLISANDLVLWWENTDGTGSNWVEHVIDGAFSGVTAVDAADFDSDGDMDVVGGTLAINNTAPDIKWWQNLDGAGASWTAHVVGDGRFSRAYDVEAADMDRDGDKDILAVAREDNHVSWWENGNALGTLWKEHLVDSYVDGARAVVSADIDGDEETDIAVAATEGNTIAWWKNGLEGRTVFAPPADTNMVAESTGIRCFVTNTPYSAGTTQYVCEGWTGTGITPSAGTGSSVGPFALTNDAAITWNWSTQYWLSVSTESNGWVDSTSGWRDRGAGVLLEATPGFLHALDRWTGDVPASNALDNPLALTMDRARSVTAVFRAVDHIITPSAGPNGSISPTGLVGAFSGESAVFQMIPDLHYHVADVLVNGQSVGPSNTYTFLDITNHHTIRATFTLDSYTFTVTNVAGVCHFATNFDVSFSQHGLTSMAHGPSSLRAGDVDTDGDADLVGAVLTTNGEPGDVVWWENDGPYATNWNTRVVWTNRPGAELIAASDIDQVQGPDLFVATSNALYLLRNDLKSTTNWVQSLVSTSYRDIQSMAVADMNGNVAKDLVAAAAPGTVAWWENMDGTGGTWFARNVTTDFDGVACIQTGDIDGDGHTDILGSATSVNAIAWWRNVNGDGSQWTQHRVAAETNWVSLLRAADLDGDGDMDLCGVRHNQNEINWWENLNVVGTAWQRHVISQSAFFVSDLSTLDVNDDGNPDIVAMVAGLAAIEWFRNPGVAGQAWDQYRITSAVAGPISMAVADINEDGKEDFVAAHSAQGYLAWWEKVSDDDTLFFPTEDAANILYQPLAYCFLQGSVVPNGKSQSKCIGWAGTGSVPPSGDGTFIGPFEFGADSSVSWTWVTRHWVDVNSSSNGITSYASGWYNQDTTLVVHAVADPGYTFAGWQGVAVTQGLDNPLSLRVEQPETVFCSFVAGDHVVRAYADGAGTIEPTGDVGVLSGSNQVFVFHADTGAVVADVLVDGGPITPRPGYTFTSVAANHTITVRFELESALTDTDGDGLLNVEERVLGTDVYVADTDGDGVGDYEEAVAGTAGTNAASFFNVSIDVPLDGDAIVAWQTVTGRVYDLWWRASLLTGSWERVAGQTNLPGSGALHNYTNGLPDTVGYFRPSVERAAP